MPEVIEMAKENARKYGSKFEIVHDMDEACKDADIALKVGVQLCTLAMTKKPALN